MKAPQERKTPYIFDDDDHRQKDNGHHDRVRVVSDEGGLAIQLGTKDRRKYSYDGPRLGPEGIWHLYRICEAWLEHHDEEL